MHDPAQPDDHRRAFVDALEQLAGAELRADYAMGRRPAPSLAANAPAAVGILIGVRTCLAWLDQLIATDSLTRDAVDGMLPVLVERAQGNALLMAAADDLTCPDVRSSEFIDGASWGLTVTLRAVISAVNGA